MARPKEFEREEALDKAQRLFWEQGYNATTTDDLRLAMGIGRQSFYDTFQSKHDIFVEALGRYNAARGALLSDIVGRHESPLQTLEAILTDIADEDAKTRTLGCLGVAAVCEFGTTDKQVHQTNELAGSVWKMTLERLIHNAKEAGEIRGSADEHAAALHLNALIAGMRVSAKGGAAPEELRSIARAALDGLRS